LLAGSRLLRAGAAAAPGDSIRLLQQLEESARYFDPKLLSGAANPLDVLLFDAASSAAITLDGNQNFRLHRLSSTDLARQLKWRTPVADGAGDLLFAELLRQFGPVGDLAPASDRRYFRMHRLREVSKVASLLIVGGGLVAATTNGLALLNAQETRSQAGTTSSRLERVLSQPDAVNSGAVDPFTMQQVVRSHDALVSHSVAPRYVLDTVSAATSQRPRVQLDNLSWTTRVMGDSTATPDAAADDATLETGDTSTETPAENGGTPDTGDGTDGPVNAATRVIVTLAGRIEPFSGNFPLAFAEIDAYIAALERQPGVRQVKRKKAPIDVDTGLSLTGELTRGQVPNAAAFTLEVTLDGARHES
jgi:hypothetical protein